ncbi:MAG: Gx transporter family protein [Clostridia bacterium]|nr:Gx transporter family protein [Clostridia bacterium]
MNRTQASSTAARITVSSMLLAVMLVLGYIESMLPSPGVPGIKLGLSNSVLIFAVYMLDIPTAFILMSLKVLLSGMMFGGVTTIIYAFSGGLVSLTAMVLLRRIPRLSPVIVSMGGGMFHNIGQVAMAILILHTPSAMLGYLGILMLAGLLSGFLTGLIARQVMKHLRASALHPRAVRRRGTLVTVLAVLVTAGTLLFAWHSMPHLSGNRVTIEVMDTAPLQDASAPPF